MILRNTKIRKRIACFFLGLITIEIIVPARAWALTSGPVQPETKQFSTADTNNLVDLFSGGFKYNIPVLDVDGYPVNLNYQSGAGMDDEASWVGLGWNLNVGSINRELRGLPDDFKGDKVYTEHYTAPKITMGGRATGKAEVSGFSALGLKGSFMLGIFSDSYTGIGAEIGTNAGLSLTTAGAGSLTGGFNLGISSSTSEGVSVNPNISLSVRDQMTANTTASMGLSANLGYNTRQGLKNLTLSQSFGVSGTAGNGKTGSSSLDVGGIGFTYNTPPYYPQVGIPYKTEGHTYSIDAGGSAFVFFFGGGFAGYKVKREVLSRTLTNPAYGALYANVGKNNPRALMDFMREKDNPVVPNLPNLPVPITTPDLFSYSSEVGGGQFRLFKGGSAIVSDAEVKDQVSNGSIGADLGFGGYFHGGVTFYQQNISNRTQKWTNQNAAIKIANYPNKDNDPVEEHAYFKQLDEKNVGNPAFDTRVQDENPVHFWVSSSPMLSARLKDKDNQVNPKTTNIAKTGRQVRRNAISYLTAEEATLAGQTKSIETYPENKAGSFTPKLFQPSDVLKISRKSARIQPHHLSEITVTGDNGKRMVYGIPVYNGIHEEYSFATDPAMKSNTNDISRNLVGFTRVDGKIKHEFPNSVDKFFHKESQPAYASSFLLTAVLSPDYVDVKDDGITPDDLGTAIKFNYTKITDGYRWRSPAEPGKALYHRALNADPNDDKSSIVYGQKDLWYLNSIETKDKIAYFILTQRDDALGVKDIDGAYDNTIRQRALKEIRLYSKTNLSTPIKTVVFNYDYSLCKGVPNNTNGGGKLTLKSLYFTYASSLKGQHFPYEFKYDGEGDQGQAYGYMMNDRWGNLKPPANNALTGFGAFRNDEFPYSIQHKPTADANAAMWNLTTVSLPTGGEIKVDYESGDYAYVQNKPAMQMVSVSRLVDKDGADVDNLYDARGVKVNVGGSLQGSTQEEKTRDFVRRYLNGEPWFYTRLMVNVTNKPGPSGEESYDYIPCYGQVDKVFDKGGGNICVILKTMNEGRVTSNPIIFAAWQKMRLEYPMYAYPGYKNRITSDRPLGAALSALVNAIGNLAELKENFNEIAKRKNFARNVKLEKSFARVTKADGFKLGGKARVKRVRITDAWSEMTGQQAPGATYGQEYFYTTENNGRTISSGVASYEPGIGNDENPLRLPVPYTEDLKGTLSNFFYLERPFGESLFPAPMVGYSQVVVKDLNETGVADAAPKTGWQQHEFYTAKDYPVLVNYDHSPENYNYKSSNWFSLFGASMVQQRVLSQGYVVVVNDMHGKPKAERTYNQSGAEIASTTFYYNDNMLDADTRRLVNKVDVIDDKGNITTGQIIGRDIDVTVDMREQETTNVGRIFEAGVDLVPGFLGFPLPIPHVPVNKNEDYHLFRSSCLLKTIQYSGVLSKVVKMVNGSVVTASNLLYDALTGEPVVIQSNNDFGDPVYQVNMPAYWMYTGMGGAYRNSNTLIYGFSTDTDGKPGVQFNSVLTAGDELFDIKAGTRYWVIRSRASYESVESLKVIDRNGGLVKSFTGDMKLLRSGYRNQLTAGGATLVTRKNPVDGSIFKMPQAQDLTSLEVLDAKVSLYDQVWAAKAQVIEGPDGYRLRPDGLVFTRIPGPDLTLTPCPLPYVPDTYSKFGAAFFNDAGVAFAYRDSPFWGGVAYNGGRFRSIAKWPCGRGTAPLNNRNWYIYETYVYFPEAPGYSIGIGVDDEMTVAVDGAQLVTVGGINPMHYNNWNVYPLRNITPGKHKLQIAVRNLDGELAGFAFDLYNDTPSGLSSNPANLGSNNIFFSSANMDYYLTDAMVKNENGDVLRTELNVKEVDDRINPFLQGILGNWRGIENKVYQVNRNNNVLAAPNIRTAGSYVHFTPYWYLSSNVWTQSVRNADSWVSTGTTTLYDRYGNATESIDPLGNYKGAQFCFNGSVPAAVADNAREREFFYDGFEDYKSRYAVLNMDGRIPDLFNIFNLLYGNYLSWLDDQISHSGRYSLKMNGPLQLTAYVHGNDHRTYPYWEMSAKGEYSKMKGKGKYPAGFNPVPDTRYVFSAWVKDNQPASQTTDLTLKVNGTSVTLKPKAWVEGWKLVEGTTNPLSAGDLAIEIAAGSSNTRLDDIRIFPYDANVKSYAYDDRNLRLMAELDENNLATFYEYDDEGTLVRLKKETERGIMTLKENRSSYRRKPVQ